MARSHARRGWRSTQPDPALIGPMLRQAGFIGSDSDPTSVRASFDADGRPRRIHARYAEGWTCAMHLSIDGSYSLSQSIRMRVSGRVPA
ncbi:hypothetical protein [Sphingomonas sp.]|jgi:hypothetical protein|uniref:hypothetical protein n=1 Tax=Sphingomonas sp. TaxID=28214 RepID=UPI002EDB9131